MVNRRIITYRAYYLVRFSFFPKKILRDYSVAQNYSALEQQTIQKSYSSKNKRVTERSTKNQNILFLTTFQLFTFHESLPSIVITKRIIAFSNATQVG